MEQSDWLGKPHCIFDIQDEICLFAAGRVILQHGDIGMCVRRRAAKGLAQAWDDYAAVA